MGIYWWIRGGAGMSLQSSTAEIDTVLCAPPQAKVLERRAGVRWRAEIMSRAEIERSPRWACAFSGERKDRRYYEIVEDTILQGFDYRYFALKDEEGEIRAIQPFFINDQDLLAGTSSGIRKLVSIDSPRVAALYAHAHFDDWVRCGRRASRCGR